MKWKKKDPGGVAAVCQLRNGNVHPFTDLRGFVPLGGSEERIYRQLREAIPILDAAIGKLVRLSGGFQVKCKNPGAQQKLEYFLRNVPCGRGQVGIDSFLGGYVDSLLTYGRSVGEVLMADGRVRGLCWGDVTRLQVCQGDSPMDVELWGPNEKGQMMPQSKKHIVLLPKNIIRI